MTTPTSPQHPTRDEQSGLTLIELMMAIAVMVVGVGALVGTLAAGSALNQVSHETAVARKAIETQIDAMRSTSFATVFARYNADPSDDPGGVGTAPGATFAVPGLIPVAGAPGGVAGQVLFSSTGPVLREDAIDAAIGMPRDLNLDSAIDALDHAADYMILPVRIRIRMQGKAGPRTVELQTQLSGL